MRREEVRKEERKGQKRRELLPQMKAARERGDFAVLRYDKLIVHKQEANGRRSDA